MTNRNNSTILFPTCKRRKVESEFSGGDVTSDGGSLLLGLADRNLDLIHDVAQYIEDQRR